MDYNGNYNNDYYFYKVKRSVLCPIQFLDYFTFEKHEMEPDVEKYGLPMDQDEDMTLIDDETNRSRSKIPSRCFKITANLICFLSMALIALLIIGIIVVIVLSKKHSH